MEPVVASTRDDGWFVPPSLEIETVAQIAADLYGIDGAVTTLRGEREQNIRIDSPSGSFVLKIAGASEDLATLDFQCRALEHIAEHQPTLPVPRLVRSRRGEMIDMIEVGDGTSLPVRLLTFLPGRTFEDIGVVSAAGLRAIGEFQGRLAATLATFTHPAQDTFMPWALDSGMLGNSDVWAHLAPDARVIVEPCRERVDHAVEAMSVLPRQVIHNDAHRGNLLRAIETDGDTDGDTDGEGDAVVSRRNDETVTGIIDFGDLVTSARAADLGVSGASFVGGQPDPAAALVDMVEGYHAMCPLDQDELAILPELVLCRAVLSAVMTDYQMHNSPHIADFVGAERVGILRTVEQWAGVDADALSRRLCQIETRPT